MSCRYDTKDGRTFWEVGYRDHTCKDGRQTQLCIWEGLCQVCAAPFQVLTPMSLERSEAFGRKHCDDHKLQPGQVRERWLAGIKAGRAQRAAS